jgi:transcriptional regulator with XRE-family HTH domain
MDKKQIGFKIKTLRTGKRLSQQELAKKLNIDRTTLSKIETGENFPAAGILVELKRIFSISIDWLLTGNGPGPIDSNDKDVSELLTTIQENRVVKHAVLGFFYEYKADNLNLFKRSENPHNEIDGGEK